MRNRLKFYGLLMLVISLTFAYLLLVFIYNWYLADDPTPQQVMTEIIARNIRWKTWGACAGGFGFLGGLLLALTLFIANSTEEFFEEMYEGLRFIPESENFPSFRNISSFFFISMLIIFIIISSDWQLGIRDGVEFMGVFVWVIFLVTTFIFIPILLMDVFLRRFLDWIIGYLSKIKKVA